MRVKPTRFDFYSKWFFHLKKKTNSNEAEMLVWSCIQVYNNKLRAWYFCSIMLIWFWYFLWWRNTSIKKNIWIWFWFFFLFKETDENRSLAPCRLGIRFNFAFNGSSKLGSMSLSTSSSMVKLRCLADLICLGFFFVCLWFCGCVFCVDKG